MTAMDAVREEAAGTAAGARPDGRININTVLRSPPENLLNVMRDEQASKIGDVRSKVQSSQSEGVESSNSPDRSLDGHAPRTHCSDPNYVWSAGSRCHIS